MQAESRYVPSAEQIALAGTIDESLVELLPVARLHSAFTEDAKTWSSLEEIGLFGITLGEEQGGSGLGAVEEALIVTALGRRLPTPSVLATIGAAHASWAGDASAYRGRRVAAAYRHNGRIIVAEDPQAELVLVRDENHAEIHELQGRASTPIEHRLWLAHLSSLTGLGAPLARVDGAQILRLRLIDAASLAGMAEATLEMAVAYANVREQFGRPIGSFQAVKHHCADMVMAARCARDQVSFAAVAVDEGRADAALQVESAFLVAASAALDNAGKNIQIHGGIGFSDEADPHLFVKTAQLLIAIGGGVDAANWRVANAKTTD